MDNRYGTTSDMIIREIDDDGASKLIAIDRNGLYLTTRSQVDRRLADVNRYGVSRALANQRLDELGIDPHQLFEENKHLIKSEIEGKSREKFLNPIKASKRGARG